MSEWRSVESFVKFSTKGVTPRYVEKSGILVLNQKCIRNHKIDYSLAQYISDDQKISESKHVKEGDILFNSTGQGTAGRCAFVKELPPDIAVVIDSHILLLRCSSYEEAQCLSYALYSFEKTLQSFMDGSTGQAELDKVRVFNLQTKIPKDGASQKKIAAVLSALDAKIELNNRINAELEAMAKTLYDYWFVQFDFPCLPPDYQSVGARKPSCHDREGKPSGLDAVCTYRAVGGLPVPEAGKHFVYVLLCLPASGDARVCDDCSFYIGMTDDLYRRWFEHKTGHGAKWTKANRPIKVIHHETFDSKEAAATREKELKTGFGRKWLKREYQKLLKFDIGGSPAHQSKLMQAGKMVYNPTLKREIPEGWEVDSIAGCTALNEFVWAEKTAPKRLAYIDLANTKNGRILEAKSYSWHEAPSRARRRLRAGDTIVGTVRPGNRSFCLVPNSDDALTGSTGFAVLTPKKSQFREFVYLTVTSETNIGRLTTIASGAAYPAVNPEVVAAHHIAFPPESLVEAFHEKISGHYDLIANNEKQTQQLTSLRDWLLPMLMNGQVEVA